jgi:hypothetical protein
VVNGSQELAHEHVEAAVATERDDLARAINCLDAVGGWPDADVDVRAMLSDREGWVSFWFYDVDHFVVPRCWLRWAFNYLQSFRKVTDGTPCDAQLAMYLPEADIVLSSDSGFIDRIEECRKYAPCLLPIAERLPRQRPQNAYHLIKRIEQA